MRYILKPFLTCFDRPTENCWEDFPKRIKDPRSNTTGQIATARFLYTLLCGDLTASHALIPNRTICLSKACVNPHHYRKVRGNPANKRQTLKKLLSYDSNYQFTPAGRFVEFLTYLDEYSDLTPPVASGVIITRVQEVYRDPDLTTRHLKQALQDHPHLNGLIIW